MNRKFITILSAAVITAAAAPSAIAANSDFAGGVYSSTDTSGTGSAKLTIYTCDDSTITAGFERTDSRGRVLSFVCDSGTVSGNSASIPFTMTASGVTYYGCISLSLDGNGGGVTINTNATNYGTVFTGYLPKTAAVSVTAAQNAPETPAVNTASMSAAAPEDITINVNGVKMDFAGDAKPIIIEGHTYVPLRSVFGSMGIDVYWDEYSMTTRLHEQLITCIKNEKILQFARTLNVEGTNVWTLREWNNVSTDTSDYTEINSEEYQPVIKDESSYAPIRVISEETGGAVSWDEATRTVDIICDVENTHKKSPEEIAGIEDFTKDAARAYINEELFIVTDEDRTPYYSADRKFYKFGVQDDSESYTFSIFNDGSFETVKQ